MSDLPVVGVWQKVAGGYALIASVANYTALSFEPRHNDGGPWSVTVPYDAQAIDLAPPNLVTIDWRGFRMTGDILTPKWGMDSNGLTTLTASGLDVFDSFGWVLAYPEPTAAVTAQPASGVYTGPAETALLALIRDHVAGRYAMGMTVPASSGRGAAITARTKWQSVKSLLVPKAAVGGIGIRFGLVNDSDTRAHLAPQVYVPADRSKEVRLSQQTGTVREWSQDTTAPTATRAVVGGAGSGAGRIYRAVTTPDSVAAAAQFRGHREVFVDGPGSFDNTELDQAGQEALASGATTTNASITAAEASGLLAFRDYAPGDQATAQLVTGLDVVDVLSAITVDVSLATGVTVTPKFGDPDAGDVQISMAQMLAAVRRGLVAVQSTRDIS